MKPMKNQLRLAFLWASLVMLKLSPNLLEFIEGIFLVKFPSKQVVKKIYAIFNQLQ